eukprot:146613-Amphidinium_carterae.1
MWLDASVRKIKKFGAFVLVTSLQSERASKRRIVLLTFCSSREIKKCSCCGLAVVILMFGLRSKDFKEFEQDGRCTSLADVSFVEHSLRKVKVTDHWPMIGCGKLTVALESIALVVLSLVWRFVLVTKT